MRSRTIIERLAAYSIALENGCVVWTGCKDDCGYGRIAANGKARKTHRVMWEQVKGPVPDGLCVLHDCPTGDNPACINIDHLWLGTNSDNVTDRERKGRHDCGRGERHGRAKISNEQALAIFRDRRPARIIGNEYGLATASVYGIRQGKTWRTITGGAAL